MQAARSAVEAYKQLQADLQKNLAQQQTYVQQQHENEMVLKELELLQDGDGVFKLMGPALVKQDREEAVATVRKRLDYIAAEVARLQAAVKEAEAKGEVLQAKIQKLQAEAVRQQTAAPPVGEAA